MNESFSATVPLEALLSAVQKYQRDSGYDQPNLIVSIDDHGVLSIWPVPVEVTSIPSIERNKEKA